MAVDRKYGHFTPEHGDIADDEPVFVFRAQDVMLPAILGIYREMCLLNGSPMRHLDGIDAARTEVEAWQAEHHVQVPCSDRPQEKP